MSTTCQPATLTKSRRKTHASWWRRKEWRTLVAEKTAGKCCEECGIKQGEIRGGRKPAKLTLDHDNRDSYSCFEAYLEYARDFAPVTCTTCNWLHEKGMQICPRCLTHYKPWRQEYCGTCNLELHPEIKAANDRWKAAVKAKQKELRDKEKARIKAWKKEHPLPKKGGDRK